jgi:hypothetical protein
MQTLKAYLYPIIIKVQFPTEDIFTTRNKIVYAHPIKVYQGIDNPIQLLLLNQDNKSVDLTNSQVWVNVQDSTTNTVVTELQVEWINITKGQGQIVLNKATLDGLDNRYYKLTIKKINTITNESVPAYIDANYGVPLDLEVLPGFY